ncbi:BnaA03g55080D, partial [Brassica napus]
MAKDGAKSQEDYKLKDMKPDLGEKWPHGGQRGGSGWISSERVASTYDLVEQMFYLYVRVVKAKDLPPNPVTSNCDPYVEVKIGNYKGKTKHFEKRTNPEWNQVFAFSKDKIQSSTVEVFVRDKEMVTRDDYIGKVVFDMHEIPTRVPPDSPLAPQWYRLEARRGEAKKRGEVMVAVWLGTQADEAFPDAWHSDASSVQGEGVQSVRAKVYVSPKLWYLRVNVIEAQDVEPSDRSQPPQAFVKTTELFTPNGTILRNLGLVLCLEGGYHVMDESTLYISDVKPTARQLWKKPIGILEVGILSAQGLSPMKTKDGKATTDPYCVAKYGQKWVRTRTIIESFSPKWNEQYMWEVYDPCTVITLGVFDNCHLGGSEKSNNGAKVDARIGKVRIRLSTLEADRIYTHSYPLLVLQTKGLKKMGEVQLAVRFTCLSLAHMMYLYGHPLLPKMHYLHPFTVNQLDSLRYQAMSIVAARLARAEPPLRKEIVEYMLDVDSHMWSMRRSKANF